MRVELAGFIECLIWTDSRKIEHRILLRERVAPGCWKHFLLKPWDFWHMKTDLEQKFGWVWLIYFVCRVLVWGPGVWHEQQRYAKNNSIWAFEESCCAQITQSDALDVHIHHLDQQWAKGAKLRVQCAVCSISLLQNESNSVFKIYRILAAVSTRSKFDVLYLRKLGKTQFVGSNIWLHFLFVLCFETFFPTYEECLAWDIWNLCFGKTWLSQICGLHPCHLCKRHWRIFGMLIW